MRSLIAVVVVGSMVVALIALLGTRATREDDLARSITQLVESSR